MPPWRELCPSVSPDPSDIGKNGIDRSQNVSEFEKVGRGGPVRCCLLFFPIPWDRFVVGTGKIVFCPKVGYNNAFVPFPARRAVILLELMHVQTAKLLPCDVHFVQSSIRAMSKKDAGVTDGLLLKW